MNDQILKDAQYRKGLSISFFNSTNSAIEMVKLEAGLIPKPKKTKGKKKAVKTPPLEDRIDYWRNHFLAKHLDYYATVIAKIGVPYKPEETIKRLKATKTVEELRTTWQLLSEDERHDKEIIKVTKELKATYEKA